MTDKSTHARYLCGRCDEYVVPDGDGKCPKCMKYIPLIDPAPSAASGLADEIERAMGEGRNYLLTISEPDKAASIIAALRSRPAQDSRDAERWKRIELAYCRANDYINALISEHSIPLESLEKIRAAYWQAVKEV